MEILTEKEIKIVTIEKETPVSNFPVEQNLEEKRESAKKVLFENNTPELYMENLKKNFSKPEVKVEKKVEPKPIIQFEAAETFFQEKTKAKEKKQAHGQVSFSAIYANETVEEKQEIVEQEIAEPEPENEIIKDNIEENSEEIEENVENLNNFEEKVDNKQKKSAKSKTRFKIFIFGLVGVLACMIGWAIYNAVEIKTLTAEMEQANKIYSVNVYSHISNIAKADDLTNEDSIFNLEKLSTAKIIPVQPTPQEKVEYSIKSNWFDRLCNWVSNLFN